MSHDLYCVSCWCVIDGPLARLGSTRCADCRDVVVGGRAAGSVALPHVEPTLPPAAHENVALTEPDARLVTAGGLREPICGRTSAPFSGSVNAPPWIDWFLNTQVWA